MSIFAYNAKFDYSYLPELHGFEWYDIMQKAAYRQYNPAIPSTAQCCSTGRLKSGYTVEKIGRNYASVKKALDKGYPILAHIDTKPATCLGYKNNYGHWTVIYGYTKDGYYKIADPTKGIKICAPRIYDKAMLNRTIYYYQVKPR